MERGGAILSSNISHNVGRPTTPTDNTDQAGCARDAPGGGGGLCVFLRRNVTLSGVRFVNNSAVGGGSCSCSASRRDTHTGVSGGGGDLRGGWWLAHNSCMHCLRSHLTCCVRPTARVCTRTQLAGGGMYVQQRCLPGEKGCGPAVLINSTFTDNEATRGGGPGD